MTYIRHSATLSEALSKTLKRDYASITVLPPPFSLCCPQIEDYCEIQLRSGLKFHCYANQSALLYKANCRISVFNGIASLATNSTIGDIAYSTACVLGVEVAAPQGLSRRDFAGVSIGRCHHGGNKLPIGDGAAGATALIGRAYGATLIPGIVTEEQRLAPDAWLAARMPNRASA